MGNIILSVCIATYNRADYIEQTLQSFLSKHNDNIEILVGDSSTNQLTREIVERYNRQFQYLKYINLGEKRGVDVDYCKTIEQATGRFCWLFSDDDIVDEDALDRVLKEISKETYDLIVINSSLYSIDLKTCYRSRFVERTADTVYTKVQFEQFFVELADILSFIGCVVISRELWNARDKRSYFGTEFVHVGVIFQELILGDVLFVAEPLIKIRLNNSQWSPRQFRIWINSWPRLVWSFELFSNRSKSSICGIDSWKMFRKVLYFRALNAYSYAEYSLYIKPYSRSVLFKIVIQSILLIPTDLLMVIFKYYASLKGREWMIKELEDSRLVRRNPISG